MTKEDFKEFFGVSGLTFVLMISCFVLSLFLKIFYGIVTIIFGIMVLSLSVIYICFYTHKPNEVENELPKTERL